VFWPAVLIRVTALAVEPALTFHWGEKPPASDKFERLNLMRSLLFVFPYYTQISPLKKFNNNISWNASLAW
jgi:hypothetical protein